MDTSSVLLIDLENFFIGREEQHLARGGLNARPYRGDPFEEDLERLLGFAQEMAGTRRLLIRRAYANYNAYHVRELPHGGRTREWYLQGVPETLMRYGVEPVQVFRFPGGGNKNAADMRLAMDATAMLVTGAGIGQFIVVTGDADFIPLTLELKRHGKEVGVIGVRGRTNEIFERYCDHFELFEELLAAREVGTGPAAGAEPVAEVGAALRLMLGRSRPIKFAAVKPLLARELNRPFDPTAFGCVNTGEFLERFRQELGIAIYQTVHDKVIDLQGAPPAPLPVQDAPSPARYQQLLKAGGGPTSPEKNTKFFVPPWPVFREVTDIAFAVLRGPDGPVPMTADEFHRRMEERLIARGDGALRVEEVQLTGVEYVVKWYFSEAVGDGAGRTRYVRLFPEVDSADALRMWLWNAKLYLLKLRLEERNDTAPIVPEMFARMVYGADPPPEFVALIRDLVEQLYNPPPAPGQPGE